MVNSTNLIDTCIYYTCFKRAFQCNATFHIIGIMSMFFSQRFLGPLHFSSPYTPRLQENSFFRIYGLYFMGLKIILATLNIYVKLNFSYAATYLCTSELCLFVLDKSVTFEAYCLQHMSLYDTFTAAAFTSTACSLLFGKVRFCCIP